MSATINFGCHPANKKYSPHPTIQDGMSNETRFFREDLDWKFLAETMARKFRGTPQVYQGACSDGSETCTLKIMWDKLTKDRPINIKAFDINPKIIANAKKGLLEIFEMSRYNAQDYIDNDDYRKYLPRIPRSHKDMYYYHSDMFQMTGHLKKGLSFEVGDAVEFSSKKQEEPCVFMFGNVLPYLCPSSRKEFFSNLGKNLAQGCIFVSGEFDERVKATQELTQKGFEELSHYIFLKK